MDSAALRKLMVEVAKKDLGEDDKVREQSIKQFKHWLETNPDVRNYDGDENLALIFLRKGKFSIQKSQEVFLKSHKFKNDYPDFMFDCNVLDPKVNVFATNGYMYASPVTDDNGHHILILKACKFNPQTCNYKDYLKVQVQATWTMLYKEVPQVLGVTYVVDMAGFSAAHAAHIPLSVFLPYMKAVQQCIPIRFKGFHFINMPGPIKWFFDLIVSHATDKMKTRFMAHNSLEELHKHVKPHTLPKEYGGTMSSQEMINWWYKEMLAAHPTTSEWNRVRLVQPVNSDLEKSLAQLPGSFRKLEVD